MTVMFRFPLKSLFIASAATLLGLTGSAVANDTYCGADPASITKGLDGFYEVQNGAGVLTMAGRTMALPTGSLSDAAIEATDDGRMTIMSSELGGTFDLEIYNGDPWQIATGVTSPLEENQILTSNDLAVLIDCDPNDLPRLFSSGTYKDPESGRDVAFKLYLFAVDQTTLYGVTVGRVQTPNGPGKAQRVLTLTR